MTVESLTQYPAVDHAGSSRELCCDLLDSIPKRDCAAVRRVERGVPQIVYEVCPVVFMTSLEFHLHDPEPTKKTPAPVLWTPCVVIAVVDEGGSDHVDEVIEPPLGSEPSRRADEFNELLSSGLAAGDDRQLSQLLRVLLLT